MDRDSHEGTDLASTLARTQPTGLPGDGTPNHGPLLEFRMARIGTGGAPTHTLGQTEPILFLTAHGAPREQVAVSDRHPSSHSPFATRRKENTLIFLPWGVRPAYRLLAHNHKLCYHVGLLCWI